MHREALDYLRYGLESQAGFVVITGEIGSGKTTLLQTLLRGLDTQTTVGRIVNTMLEPRELLETIMIDFGLDPAGRSKPLLLRDLAQFLVDQRLAGRLVLLVIDEAQNLSARRRSRSCGCCRTSRPRSRSCCRSCWSASRTCATSWPRRSSSSCASGSPSAITCAPLDADETANYINHRLRRAAIGAPLEFPRDVDRR